MTGALRGRRRFFRLLAREAVVRRDEIRGIPQLSLAELTSLPDRELGTLIPVIPPGVEVVPHGGEVRLRRSSSAQAEFCFETSPISVFLFNRFNGKSSLQEISTALAASQGCSATDAFLQARAFFTRLVQAGVCLPANPTP